MKQSQDDITHVYKSLEKYRETAECSAKDDDEAWINDLLSHLGKMITESILLIAALPAKICPQNRNDFYPRTVSI